MDPISIKRPSDPYDLIWNEQPLPHFCYSLFSPYAHLSHAVLTRHGGMSRGPYHSLNTSFGVGDHPDHVAANLHIIRDFLGARRLIHMKQVHGTRILAVHREDEKKEVFMPSADALITDAPGLALLVKQADCQGVILFDPGRRVVAVVHCGWRGNANNILSKTTARMQREFGCRACDLLACIGPSLGPCCAEFVDHEKLFPEALKVVQVNGTAFFDLKAFSRRQLLDAGLKKEHIQVSGLCTRCRTDLFYSYRGEGRTGRFGTVAMLT